MSNKNRGKKALVEIYSKVQMFRMKNDLLRKAALTEEILEQIGSSPAGTGAENAVFFSLCNGKERARVFTGIGTDPGSAWDAASNKVNAFLEKGAYLPKWVKVDVVYTTKTMDKSELTSAVAASRSEFFRYGIAFDNLYETALLEAELNGNKIYKYDDTNIALDFDYLNRYLRRSGRAQLEALPEAYTLFQCLGWICDEDNTVYKLNYKGLEYGRRNVELIDADYAKTLLTSAGNFLANQVNEDGSFIYGLYPRFDKEIDNYNILRHSSTIWALVNQYRVIGDETLVKHINSTIEYMLRYIVYSDADTAYLYEEKSDEIKLGGNAIVIITLTEYMDVFGKNERYTEVCRQLGTGILSMLDQGTGVYVHVLNGDFSLKEKYRTVYYDGEATFALSRLYELTGNQTWLDAAMTAVHHFIAADYVQYRDHWVAYSMNEVTKYIDDPKYYTFALRNAQENLKSIYRRDTTYHTYLELLMSTFELYDRMITKGITCDYLEASFHIEDLLKTIYARADRMLNGYFYPEYAMYMKNPQRVVDTFIVRHDGYRVRIDDVQHNIGGFYKYYVYYDKLVAYGLLEARDSAQ